MTDMTDSLEGGTTITVEIKPIARRWLRWTLSLMAGAMTVASCGVAAFLLLIYTWPMARSSERFSTFWHWLVTLSGGVAGLTFLRQRPLEWDWAPGLEITAHVALPVACIVLIVWSLTRIHVPGRNTMITPTKPDPTTETPE